MCATNGYAFKAPNGWVLVDAPQGAVNWLEKEGIDPQLILLTHQHFDHVLGAGSVSVRFNCPIWAFADYAAELTLESLFNHFEDGDLKISPYTIERKILETVESAKLKVLGLGIEVVHVPGHSPDSICFYLQEQGLVFGGDVLFQMGIGRTDFPDGDTELLLGGIREKLFHLGGDVIVFPGHGPQTTIGEERAQNPFFCGP